MFNVEKNNFLLRREDITCPQATYWISILKIGPPYDTVNPATLPPTRDAVDETGFEQGTGLPSAVSGDIQPPHLPEMERKNFG